MSGAELFLDETHKLLHAVLDLLINRNDALGDKSTNFETTVLKLPPFSSASAKQKQKQKQRSKIKDQMHKTSKEVSERVFEVLSVHLSMSVC